MARPKRSLIVGVAFAALIATVGFLAADLPAESAIAASTISLRSTQLGRILANSQGHTLYLFAKDRNGKSSCSASCAKVWRPLVVHGTPTGGPGVKASLLGTVTRADGSRQVTYHRHPLYTFVRDTAAGRTKGEGVSAFGGKWYAVSAAGTAVLGTTTTTTTTQTTTTTPTTTTVPTTTAPPPPAAQPGRYCGFTGNGSGICFTITPGSPQFWTSGHFGIVNAPCDPGPTYFDVTYDTSGQSPIAADLSFNFTATVGDAAGTVVTGTLDTAGNAQGHLHVADSFDYSGTHYTCQLDTDWTAKFQP